MYLIDTDVLSALRRRVRAPNLLAWISAQRTADLYLSAGVVCPTCSAMTAPTCSSPPLRWSTA